MDWDALFAFRVPEETSVHAQAQDVADDLGLALTGRRTLEGVIDGVTVRVQLRHTSVKVTAALPPGLPVSGDRQYTRLQTHPAWTLYGSAASRAFVAHPVVYAALDRVAPECVEVRDGAVVARAKHRSLRRAGTLGAFRAVLLASALVHAWRATVVEVCAAHGLAASDGAFVGEHTHLVLRDGAWQLTAVLGASLPPGTVLRRRESGDAPMGDVVLDQTLGLRGEDPGLVRLLRDVEEVRDAAVALLHAHDGAAIEGDALRMRFRRLPTGPDLARILEDLAVLRHHWPR